MQNLKKILETKSGGMMKSVAAAVVVDFADRILLSELGADNAGRIKTQSIKNKVLMIYVESSVLAQEVKFCETELLEQINNKFGENTVIKLKIVQKQVEFMG